MLPKHTKLESIDTLQLVCRVSSRLSITWRVLSCKQSFRDKSREKKLLKKNALGNNTA